MDRQQIEHSERIEREKQRLKEEQSKSDRIKLSEHYEYASRLLNWEPLLFYRIEEIRKDHSPGTIRDKLELDCYCQWEKEKRTWLKENR